MLLALNDVTEDEADPSYGVLGLAGPSFIGQLGGPLWLGFGVWLGAARTAVYLGGEELRSVDAESGAGQRGATEGAGVLASTSFVMGWHADLQIRIPAGSIHLGGILSPSVLVATDGWDGSGPNTTVALTTTIVLGSDVNER